MKKGTYRLPLSRASVCLSCEVDLKVCLNCSFYDEAFYQQCRESEAELVRDKEGANFCDFFKPSKKTNIENENNKRLEDLNRLFQESPEGKSSPKKLSKLEDLFRK